MLPPSNSSSNRVTGLRRAPAAALAAALLALLHGCGAPAPAPGPTDSVDPAPSARVVPTPDDVAPPCTLRACTDGVALVLHLAPEDADVGVHRFDLTIDGARRRCELTVATRGEDAHATCGDGVSIQLGATTRTVEQPSPVPGTVMIGFERVPDRYEARIGIFGTPHEVRLAHAVRGRPTLEHTVVPTYATERPNGPHCDPACQRASIEL